MSEFRPIKLVTALASDSSAFTTSLISFKEDWVFLARFPISLATTAKPLPASPALAASMDAFNASKLVDVAISSIILTVLPIFFVPLKSLSIASIVF